MAVRPGLPGLSADDRAALDAKGTPRALRFKVRQGRTSFDDAVHGTITFDSANIEDFVILRSDGHPTYHLSVVVDDVDMAITHVMRGDDHISNTPKHVLLFEAMGAPIPRFAHVPLILGADKKRLSKRHGATSVMEYERQGYFSAAMVNFLALLGWSPGDDREMLSKTELIEAFSLEAISGGNAVFNTEKLDWMNGQYIGRMSADELSAALASASRGGRSVRGPHRARSRAIRAAARTPAPARQTAPRLHRAGTPAAYGRGRLHQGSRREASLQPGFVPTHQRAAQRVGDGRPVRRANARNHAS